MLLRPKSDCCSNSNNYRIAIDRVGRSPLAAQSLKGIVKGAARRKNLRINKHYATCNRLLNERTDGQTGRQQMRQHVAAAA